MTVEFDHLTPGTPAAAWHTARAALPELAPPGAGHRLLVLAAHPDDETLGAGGLIAAAARRGAAVTVVIATDGEASHPQSSTHTPQQLSAIRRREARAAVAALAPAARLVRLGLPDGCIAEHVDALTRQVTALAAETACTHLVSPWRGDQHPDHETCARVAEEAAAVHGIACWQYPIWAWHWADPDGGVLPLGTMRSLHLAAGHRRAKAAALRAYPSQHGPLSDRPGDEPILPPDVLAHFTGADECFVVRAPASMPAYFDALYARDPDPWGLRDRFYEQRRRAVLLAALPRPRFRRAFEPGCATGLLTEQLAGRCDEVVAWDVASAALEQTAARVDRTRVRLHRGAIPDAWPDGEFDLIVLSEVGYYSPDLDLLSRRVLGSLSADGVLVACHWRRPAPDHPHSADEVHAELGTDLVQTAGHVEDDFLLHVWTRSGESVAQAEGIVG